MLMIIPHDPKYAEVLAMERVRLEKYNRVRDEIYNSGLHVKDLVNRLESNLREYEQGEQNEQDLLKKLKEQKKQCKIGEQDKIVEQDSCGCPSVLWLGIFTVTAILTTWALNAIWN